MGPALAVAAFLGLGLDWAQTTTIARAPATWLEVNPILGRHPSVGQVNTYFAAAALTVGVVGRNLPARTRAWWFGAVAAVELGNVVRNRAVGIRLTF